MAPERGRPIAKPESDSEDDDDEQKAAADGGGVERNALEDAASSLASETKEERAARKKAARAARRVGDAAPANRGDGEATTRECKLCGANKPLHEYPARQLKKARSACSACCSAQADADAPNAERKRKLTKREKLAEAIELRKKKKAERAAGTVADVATDGAKDALPNKEDESRKGFTSTNRYDPTVDDESDDDDDSSSSSSSSSSSEDEEEPAATADDGLTSEERELRSKQVFVGGIPFTKTAEEIEEAFMDDMLTVDSVDCMTFPDTGRFRGIAIVTFASASIAAEALRWHDSEWDGMTLVVKPYAPKQADTTTTSVKPAGDVSKVDGQHLAFVANLDYSVTEDVLRETFEDITDIRMGTDKETGDFRGYAHVEFATDEALERALAKNGEELIGGRCMKVTYATARRANKKSAPPKGKETKNKQRATAKRKSRP
jgi:nucleolin